MKAISDFAGVAFVGKKGWLNLMSNLEKIKQIAEQMPDSPEKEQGLQAYENLKLFETIADSFDKMITGATGEKKKARAK